MASTTADDVAAVLLESGWHDDDACAFVHAAGTPEQRRTVRSLADVAATGCPFESPTVMVVGPTVDRTSASAAVVRARKRTATS